MMTDNGMAESDPTAHRYTRLTTAAVGSAPGRHSLTITATDTAYPPDPVSISTGAVSLEVSVVPMQVSHTFPAGWNMVGYGHTAPQNLGDPFGDGAGGTLDTFRNAWYVQVPTWVVGPLQTWNPAVLGYKTVGVDCIPFETDVSVVEPWFGYWFYSAQPDLAWRQPLPPGPPACEP